MDNQELKTQPAERELVEHLEIRISPHTKEVLVVGGEYFTQNCNVSSAKDENDIYTIKINIYAPTKLRANLKRLERFEERIRLLAQEHFGVPI